MPLEDAHRCRIAVDKRFPIDLDDGRPVPESAQEKDEIDNSGDGNEVSQSEDQE